MPDKAIPGNLEQLQAILDDWFTADDDERYARARTRHTNTDEHQGYVVTIHTTNPRTSPAKVDQIDLAILDERIGGLDLEVGFNYTGDTLTDYVVLRPKKRHQPRSGRRTFYESPKRGRQHDAWTDTDKQQKRGGDDD